MVDKIEMSLDDIIKSTKQPRGTNRRGRGGGQRSSGSLGRRGSGGVNKSNGAVRGQRQNRSRMPRSSPYSRVSIIHLLYTQH